MPALRLYRSPAWSLDLSASVSLWMRGKRKFKSASSKEEQEPLAFALEAQFARRLNPSTGSLRSLRCSLVPPELNSF